MSKEIKKLDFGKSEFVANGVKYYIKNTLSIRRFIEFEKYQNHFGFGLSFQGIFEKIDQSIKLANQGKGVEAWNILFNMKEGIAHRIEERTHPALMICSLFIVTADEDISEWDEKSQEKKFDDWNIEGYDINDFFSLAANLVRGFLPIYDEISKDISGKKPDPKK